MPDYKVLKPFQHIHGYKRPGDMAELSLEEAEKKIAAGEVEAPKAAEISDSEQLEPKPKRRIKPEVIEDES